MKAGEYMTIFKKEYEDIRYKNNIDLIDEETKEKLLDIVN